MTHSGLLTRFALGITLVVVIALAGCGTPKITDPLADLSAADTSPNRKLAAMEILDESPSKDYIDELHRVIWRPGYYTIELREAALERLERLDPSGLKRTIRQRLPNMGIPMWPWLTRLSEIIAERGWSDLSPALVSSWARPTMLVQHDHQRPEYIALANLHGADNVSDVVFDMFVESNSVALQGLRTRCWELLIRLGQKHRLVQLLTRAHVPDDDAMLLDLQAGARDLGIIPINREEILWVRNLRKPERAEFWSQAVAAVGSLDPARRADVELRDLAIIVAAFRHEPEMLSRSRAELYSRVEAYLRTQRHHTPRSNYNNMRSGNERLYEYRDVVTWGDLAAMLMAIRAFQSPGMVEHLFDFAERDREDKTTEYGGIIALDENGNFELLEFPPRIREHDHKFIAPQAMFDAGYTGLFHYHYHAQHYRNSEFAGPGLGDMNYADNTRANCLVFTFVNRDTLNMDYYRHGRVIVDLGEIHRR